MSALRVLRTTAFLIGASFVVANTQFQRLPMGRSQYIQMEAARATAPPPVAYGGYQQPRNPYPMPINVQDPRQPQNSAYPQPIVHRVDSDSGSGLYLNSGLPRITNRHTESLLQPRNSAGHAQNSGQPRYSVGYPENNGQTPNFPGFLQNSGQPRNSARNSQDFGQSRYRAGGGSDSIWKQNPGFVQNFGEYPQNPRFPPSFEVARRTG